MKLVALELRCKGSVEIGNNRKEIYGDAIPFVAKNPFYVSVGAGVVEGSVKTEDRK